MYDEWSPETWNLHWTSYTQCVSPPLSTANPGREIKRSRSPQLGNYIHRHQWKFVDSGSPLMTSTLTVTLTMHNYTILTLIIIYFLVWHTSERRVPYQTLILFFLLSSKHTHSCTWTHMYTHIHAHTQTHTHTHTYTTHTHLIILSLGRQLSTMQKQVNRKTLLSYCWRQMLTQKSSWK